MGSLLLEFYFQFHVSEYWRERLEEQNSNLGHFLYCWKNKSKYEELINIRILREEWVLQTADEMGGATITTPLFTQEDVDRVLGELERKW